MKHDSLIFDLDGTLWDACPTTAYAWNKRLKELNLEKELTGDDIRSVAGFPQQVCIEKLLPTQLQQNPNLIAELTIAEKYAIEERGGELFEGVKEWIPKLAEHYQLFIVSNCLDWYLNLFFEKSGLKNYFTDWDCIGKSGLPKSEMISELITIHNLQNPVYIGDTEGDEEAAIGAKIDFIHAKYGFGKPRGDHVQFDSFKDLIKYLINHK